MNSRIHDIVIQKYARNVTYTVETMIALESRWLLSIFVIVSCI